MIDKELKNRAILLTYGGSISYGTNTQTSDVDIRGIAIEPQSTLFGLNQWEQFTDSESDTVIYGLKKFCKLAWNFNPNAIEFLWTQDSHIIKINEVGQTLKNNRDIFSSQKCISSFEGFMKQCDTRISKEKDKYKKLKTLMHKDRLLRMGTEFLLTGELNVYRQSDTDLLLAIRNGDLSDDEIQKIIYADRILFDVAKEKTKLPVMANKEDINSLMFELYQIWLEQNK